MQRIALREIAIIPTKGHEKASNDPGGRKLRRIPVGDEAAAGIEGQMNYPGVFSAPSAERRRRGVTPFADGKFPNSNPVGLDLDAVRFPEA